MTDAIISADFDDIYDEALIPPLYQSVQTRLGLPLEVATQSEYHHEIKILDSNGSITRLHPRNWFALDEEIDRVMRPFFKAALERYMPRTLLAIEMQIELLMDLYKQNGDINETLSKCVLECKNRGYQNISAIRRLVEWFIAYEVEGLDFDLAQDIRKLEYGGQQNQYYALYGLDAENGPFVREEMRILQAAALDPRIHLEDRVVLKLCLEFGLRPIQIALLKQKDFSVNDQLGLANLSIPRVKQRDQYRRTTFTDRLVSNELADMISLLIEIHEELYTQKTSKVGYGLSDAPLIMRRHSFWASDSSSNPYILTNTDSTTKKNLISNTHTFYKEYLEVNWESATNHISSQGINYRLERILPHLPVSPRTGRTFQLNPYRFRYTLGTNAVTGGMTEVEVADLLDHSVTGSVKHYFHYTHEMFEILEDSTLDRVENKFFTAAWSKQRIEGNLYDVDVVEPATAILIGKCQKGSICSLEPAVACYQCENFCPSKDVRGHKKALKSLKARAEKAHQCSNRSVAHQFDEAIAGCSAAVTYAEGEVVYSIQDASDQIALTQLEESSDE